MENDTADLASSPSVARPRSCCSRRQFLAASAVAAGTVAATRLCPGQDRQASQSADTRTNTKAQIAITLDLEMSRHYPRRGMLEWDYQKGNLDAATKQYSVESARIAKDNGGLIHFFCVGQVLEHSSVEWLQEIAQQGHPIGNHTYDHVNVHARTADQIQYRFQRAPWLIEGKSIDDVIRDNVRVTSIAMRERAGIEANGFRTPGGFRNGLSGREDLQQMFLDLGFKWVSSQYPLHKYGNPKEEPTDDVYDSIVAAQKSAQPFVYPTGLIEVPMSPISDVGAFRSTYWKLEWFLKATRMAIEWAIETGGVFDFLAHPSCLVIEDPEFEIIKMICQLVREAGDKAEIVGLDKVAARVAP